VSSRLLRVLSFILLTVGLTWVWIGWGVSAYERLLLAVAGPVLELFGVKRIVDSPARERFIAYVPFLVLMCLTPGLSLRRRLIGTLAGCLLLLLAHIGLVGVEQWSQSRSRPTRDPFSTLFPAALFADSLPFMLWAVIAHRWLRDWFAKLITPPAGGRS
jgi:hypothetical protein